MKKLSFVCMLVLMVVCLAFSGCDKKETSVKQEPKPFFEEHGLSENAYVDQGQFSLENGSMYRHKDGTNYQRKTAYWEVKSGTETDLGNGRKEVTFTAYCYFPVQDEPVTNQPLIWGCDSEIYDYYTGYWFTEKDSKGNTSKEENTYTTTFEKDGAKIEITHSFSTEWKYDVPGYHRVLVKEYAVQCPVEYDGLVFCAHERSEIYEEDDENEQESKELVNILECEDIDATKTLRFRIR